MEKGKEGAPHIGNANPETSRRDLGREFARMFRREIREGYAETRDPFGPGGTLVEGFYDTEEMAKEALVGLGTALGALYVVADRRIVLKTAVASVLMAGAAGAAEAATGKMLELTLEGGTGSATVEFLRLDGDTFYFRSGTNTFHRPITHFDEASQQKIRAAAGSGNTPQPAPPEYGESMAWSVHPLIRPVAMPEAAPEDLENIEAVSAALTLRLPHRERGKTLEPLIAPGQTSIWSQSLDEIGAERLWALEESNWVYRGEIPASYGANILAGEDGEGGIPVRDAIIYGEGKKARMIHIMFSSLGAARSEAKASGSPSVNEAAVRRAVQEDYRGAEKRLTELFGEPTETTYGPDFFGSTPVRGGRIPARSVLRWDWGDTAFLLQQERGIYAGLIITTTAEADTGGVLNVPEKSAIETHLRHSVQTNEAGFTYIDGIPTTNQEGRNDCAPANAERMLAHQGLIRPGTNFLFDLAGECETDVSGTNMTKFRSALAEAVKGTDCEVETCGLSIREIQENINVGTPMMVELSNSVAFRRFADQYTAERLGLEVGDLRDTEAVSRAMQNMNTSPGEAPRVPKGQASDHHAMLITGVGPDGKEVILSHPWGNDRTVLIVPFSVLEGVAMSRQLTLVKPQ